METQHMKYIKAGGGEREPLEAHLLPSLTLPVVALKLQKEDNKISNSL